MKMETPFKGQLAVVGVRGRSGHFLSLRGQWTLAAGAVVYHQPQGLTGHHGTTVIGHITGIHVWAGDLIATGNGVDWLDLMLVAGSHKLSMEMRDMKTEGTKDAPVIVSGQVRAALLVRADAYSWSGVKA